MTHRHASRPNSFRAHSHRSRLRLVAQQQQLTLPRSMLARFCATCSLIHVPGFNCDVRVQLTTCSRRSRVRIGARVKSRKLAVVRNCWECGAATRQRCDADAPAEPRGAQRGARASQVPAMAAARGGGGGGGGARVPPCASAQLDLFGLGSEFIAFSSL